MWFRELATAYKVTRTKKREAKGTGKKKTPYKQRMNRKKKRKIREKGNTIC